MTAHELARQLLAGPDNPVSLRVSGVNPETGKWDSWWGKADKVGTAIDNTVELLADFEVAELDEDEG